MDRDPPSPTIGPPPTMPDGRRPPDDPFILHALDLERRDVIEPRRPCIGDLVRVRLSGECPAFHERAEDGQVGLVACYITAAELAPDGVPDPKPDRGHFYAVDFDHPVGHLARTFNFSQDSGIYAAAELRLLARPEARP